MAAIIARAMRVIVQTPLPWNQALSGIFGSISLTAWICLLVPQLIKNYRAQSAEALSMAFLFVWLLGDLANLSGALFTDLAPTAVAIGSYFIFADLILVGQCMYYNTSNASRARHNQHVEQIRTSGGTSEEAPLLGARRGSSASTSAAVGASAGMDSLGKILAGDDDGQENLSWWQNGISLLAVYVIGVGAWAISYMVGVWDSGGSSSQPSPSDDLPHIIGMALGYLSAAFYLCARIPQIVKNYREQSCEGLAILFFMLSLTGNLMYGLSLITYNPTKEEFIKELPWLLGSLGTIIQDCIIFIQFRIYAPDRQTTSPTN